MVETDSVLVGLAGLGFLPFTLGVLSDQGVVTNFVLGSWAAASTYRKTSDYG